MTTTINGEMPRGSSSNGNNLALEDRFEVLKEIGDGSFGNVVLARVRTAGASVARRGTIVSYRCYTAYCRSFLTLPMFPPFRSLSNR
jgi:meiosis induction protein kinase IME2/SME1